jgi:hypothetical protein
MKPRRIVEFCFAASLSLLCTQVLAQAATQTMYKCKDAAGKITYTGSECNLLGLTSAGEVTGRASVTPALKVPPQPQVVLPPPPPQETVTPPAPPDKAGRAEDTEAIVGQDGRRCFKTAKGMRCNDSTD